MSKRHNSYVIQFLQKAGYPELVDLWCETENQEHFLKLRFIKDCEKKRPISSFLLFCQDRRSDIIKDKPYYPITRITCLLAKEWQVHKEHNDDVYNKYKILAEKHFFFYKHHDVIVKKYPHFCAEDIEKLLTLMFQKSKTSLENGTVATE